MTVLLPVLIVHVESVTFTDLGINYWNSSAQWFLLMVTCTMAHGMSALWARKLCGRHVGQYTFTFTPLSFVRKINNENYSAPPLSPCSWRTVLQRIQQKPLVYWAVQAGLLTPLSFTLHRLRPLAGFTSGAYFLHNGRRWQWICEVMMMKWCLMSSDVGWHIRDKLWPMPKHGSI